MTKCDFCKKDFELNKHALSTQSLSMMRNGEQQECEVCYFVCPHCKRKYIFCIRNALLRSLIAEQTDLLKHHDNMTQSRFERKLHAVKRKIYFEETMLLNKYRKRYKQENEVVLDGPYGV